MVIAWNPSFIHGGRLGLPELLLAYLASRPCLWDSIAGAG